jgi:hypothetical protein
MKVIAVLVLALAVVALVGCGGESSYDPETVVEMVGGADVLQVEGPFVLVRETETERCHVIDTSTQYEDHERGGGDDFWIISADCP